MEGFLHLRFGGLIFGRAYFWGGILRYGKTQFFLGGILSKQSFNLFFQTIESAKCAFASMAGSGEPAFLHVLFLKNKKQNSRKNYMAMFSC